MRATNRDPVQCGVCRRICAIDAENFGSQYEAHASINLRRFSNASSRLSLFRLIADDVREGGLRNLARDVGEVASPIPEAGGREAEWARQEADIIAASREGRIQGPAYITK